MKIITFGCRLNAFESVVIQKQQTGLENVVVINTCAVTAEAERQCRQAVRKAARDYPGARIVVTGCSAQLHPEEYARMPEVYKVLGNKEKLCPELFLSQDRVQVHPVADLPIDVPVLSEFDGRVRAFLQIQQGCDHACTFCIVPQTRGPSVGLGPERVLQEARAFIEKGIKEIVLTGVDITAYPYGFTHLVERILTEVPGLERLRFGSLDPACLDASFIRLAASYPVMMPHFHLSIQAGSNLILKRMGRRHLKQDIISLCEHLRQVRPESVFGADFITGFPTESEADFEETMDLVRSCDITHLHVFPYSIRPGTPAAKMPMVPMVERRRRATRLRALGARQLESLLDQQLGKRMPVLVEQVGIGMTENYLKVRIAPNLVPGQIETITIRERDAHELVG